MGKWQYIDFESTYQEYLEIEITADSLYSYGSHDMFEEHADSYMLSDDSIRVFNQRLHLKIDDLGKLHTEYAGRRIVMTRLTADCNQNAAIRYIELMLNRHARPEESAATFKEILWKSYFGSKLTVEAVQTVD